MINGAIPATYDALLNRIPLYSHRAIHEGKARHNVDSKAARAFYMGELRPQTIDPSKASQAL